MNPQKVLIFPGGLQIGGAERVAANISRYAPESAFEFHYLVFEGHENVYGPEIEARGGTVITVPQPRSGYAAYLRTLNQLMKENAYTAVHSHTMFNSGINLVMAKIHGIPVRIAHSHTTKTERKVSLAQRLYEKLMRGCIVGTATHCFACGVEAGFWLFGRRVFEKKGIVMRNGIDTVSFAWSAENREKIRRQYGLENAFVIGHTGTLLQVKNQQFLIRLMPRILEQKPEAVLMLVGGDENGEKAALEQLARECGVSDRVIFSGAVLNVNEYLSAFDVFAFPSLREGTPLALLEAQTNGLPCVVSDRVPSDAFLTDLVTPLSLEMPDEWVSSICRAKRESPEFYPDCIRRAGYDAAEAYNRIYDAYRGRVKRPKATVSLSFDDGRGDNTRVLDEILLPRNLPATLNITTGYVDGSCPAEQRPSAKAAMKKEDVIRLGKSPLVEIALHGDFHRNDPQDILAGREKLLRWLELPETHKFGFASPESKLHPEQWETESYRLLRSKLLYMRDSYRIREWKQLRTLCRKAGRVLHIPLFFRIAYGDTPMAFRDGQIVYSACVLKDTTFEQVRSLLDSCIKTGKSVTLMFHSILEDCSAEDAWSWERKKFERLCDYLEEKQKEGVLTVCTTRELFEQLP